MWELDHKEGWAWKNWCFWTVVLEKTLESSLDCKIKPINPKGNQSWIFIGRTDAEAEAPILWPPDAKSWLIGKDSDARKDRGQWEKGTTEDELVGWHHQLNGHEFEQAPGDGEGQGSLVCCSPWGHRVRQDLTNQLLHTKTWSGTHSESGGDVLSSHWAQMHSCKLKNAHMPVSPSLASCPALLATLLWLGRPVTGGKGAGHNFWKTDIAQGHNISWLESNRTRLDLDPESASEMTHPELPWLFQGTLYRVRAVGAGPDLGNLCPLPKIVGIVLPLISMWNYSAYKN